MTLSYIYYIHVCIYTIHQPDFDTLRQNTRPCKVLFYFNKEIFKKKLVTSVISKCKFITLCTVILIVSSVVMSCDC